MTPVFDAYAAYYDLLYQDKDYSAESEYLNRLIQKHSPGSQQILELGCGTGGHATQLAALGYRVLGVDMSQSMLSRANAARDMLPAKTAEQLEFVHGDIRDWRCPSRHDAAISIFHVLSYQTGNADVLAALATAAAHLSPGGLLVFDCWYGPAVLAMRPDVRLLELENQRIRLTRIANPRLLSAENVVEVEYRLLIEDCESGLLQRLREAHRMRYFFRPELELFLDNAGFEPLSFEESLSGNALSESTWSALIVARLRA